MNKPSTMTDFLLPIICMQSPGWEQGVARIIWMRMQQAVLLQGNNALLLSLLGKEWGSQHVRPQLKTPHSSESDALKIRACARNRWLVLAHNETATVCAQRSPCSSVANCGWSSLSPGWAVIEITINPSSDPSGPLPFFAVSISSLVRYRVPGAACSGSINSFSSSYHSQIRAYPALSSQATWKCDLLWIESTHTILRPKRFRGKPRRQT